MCLCTQPTAASHVFMHTAYSSIDNIYTTSTHAQQTNEVPTRHQASAAPVHSVGATVQLSAASRLSQKSLCTL